MFAVSTLGNTQFVMGTVCRKKSVGDSICNDGNGILGKRDMKTRSAYFRPFIENRVASTIMRSYFSIFAASEQAQ